MAGWVGVVAGWDGVQFCCCETKLLMYHKGGFSLLRGDGGWWGVWGGGGVD